MSTQISPLSLDSVLQARALGDPGQPYAVYDIAGKNNQLFYFLSVMRKQNAGMFNSSYSQAFGMNSTGFMSNDQTYKVTVLDPGYVTATIATRTVSGSNLVLTFTDPTYVGFRVKDVIANDVNLNVKGQVISAAPGTITIQPIEGLSAFTAAHFAVNDFIRVLYDTSANRLSAGKTRQDQAPTIRENRVSTTRESSNWSMRDNTASFVRWESESGMWYDGRIDRMLKRFLRQLEVKFLYSNYAANEMGVEGEQDSNGGLDWCIKNRNGVYLPLSTALTRNVFERWLADVRNRKAGGYRNRPTLVMGRSAYNRVAGFMNDYIQFAGKDNTFGAEVGTNIRVIGVNGDEYNLLILDFLSDPYFNSTISTIPGVNSTVRSNDIYLLDMDPVDSGNGMGELPPIQMIHWGKENSSPFYVAYMQGMGTGVEATNDQILTAAMSNKIVTDIETSSVHLMTMCGIDMPVGEFSGKIEYTN